jgi:alpha-N-arabinofuranosidase
MTHRYGNPVIPGFNPDPSVCRDGEDYYLVTSSFEFFPGVPIYHSRNLANWKLIGHCLDRDSQLPLGSSRASGGVYAPTLRKSGDRFFMTTTNVSSGGNFIVNAQDIRGPWSEPALVDQGGIDPSLLFEDGKAYFCSAGEEGGASAILLCEVDPLSGRRLTPSRVISRGCCGRFPEAPHIYRVGGWYYLVLAEGGTEYGHMVTIQRSRDAYGPYQACPRTPLVSHKDRGGHPIQALGHADMLEDHAGNWWLVCLGIRPLGWPMLHNLGRETFLLPLSWEDEWPKAGTMELEMEGPLPAAPERRDFGFEADFTSPALDPRWTFIRNPDMARYRAGGGVLRLLGNGQDLSQPLGNPVFLGIRQPGFESSAEAAFDVSGPAGKAGLSAYYSNDYHYDFFVERNGLNERSVVLRRRIHDLEAETYRQKVAPEGELSLRISAGKEDYAFSYRVSGGASIQAGLGATAGLCTEGTRAMSFTGVFLGVFCSEGEGTFTRFSLRP